METFSFGIWKSVYLAATTAGSVVVAGITMESFYQGAYPTVPLTDTSHAGFELRLGVTIDAAGGGLPAGGIVRVSSSFGAIEQTMGAVPKGESTVRVVVPVPRGVRLWWPAGLGDQALYNITITVTPPPRSSSHHHSQRFPNITVNRQIGFRSIALVTTRNDTDPATMEKNRHLNGSNGETMFLRINGAAVFSRGGNKVRVVFERRSGMGVGGGKGSRRNEERQGGGRKSTTAGIFVRTTPTQKSDPLSLLRCRQYLQRRRIHIYTFTYNVCIHRLKLC